MNSTSKTVYSFGMTSDRCVNFLVCSLRIEAGLSLNHVTDASLRLAHF